MVQIISSNSLAGIRDEAQGWGQYFGEVDERANTRWQQREARRRYDEQNRYNRDESMSYRDFMGANAGQFDDMSGELGGLRPQNVAPAAATGIVGTTAAAPAAVAPATDAAPANTAAVPTQSDIAASYARNRVNPIPNAVPVTEYTQLNASERQAYNAYLAASDLMNQGAPSRTLGALQNPLRRRRTGNEAARIREAEANLARVGLSVVNGQLVRLAPATSTEDFRVTDPGLLGPNMAAPGAATQGGLAAPEGTTGPNPAQTAMGGAGSITEQYYNGANDTSRGLQPTREMQLIQTVIRDSLRRADLAAAHGQREIAQEAFSQALQGQASYLQQMHMQLFRAASAGSNAAAASLLEMFHGYPEGTVQIQPTDERNTRFNIRIRNNDGNFVTATEVPLARADLMGGLLNLVDAAGQSARTEANQHLQETLIEQGVRLQVASMEQRTALMRIHGDIIIEQLGNQAAAAMARGEGEVKTDSEGNIFWSHTGVDAHGDPVALLDRITITDEPSPNTNGNGRTSVARATGVVGVGAN